MLKTAFVSITAAIMLASCSSLPPDPCSREGIEYRAKSIWNSFAREHRSDIREIRQAARYFEGETTIGAMRLVFAARNLERLVENFRSDVVPEISAISDQCGTNDNMRELFFDFLRDEGVNNEVLDWAETIAAVIDEDV